MANVAIPSTTLWPLRPWIAHAYLASLATMTKATTLSRVREIRLARGLVPADVARAADMDPSTYHKIDIGKRGVTPNFAQQIASALDVPRQELYAAIGSPVPAIGAFQFALELPVAARRFAAARWAYWNDELDSAADDLKPGVTEELLRAIEAGTAEADDALLIKFHKVTKIPLTWFSDGDIEGIPARLLGRIVYHDPDLVKDDAPGQRGGERRGHSRGGSSEA